MPGAVLVAFAKQAEWSAKLGSPFMERLCQALPGALDASTRTGAAVLDWPGDPIADALVLRLTGGLHALVRAGALPELARLYPPLPLPEADALQRALRDAVAAENAALCAWLSGAPQTNEVGRSAVLMSGLLVAAAATHLPLRLFELGSSAGLNLRLDSYAYRLGGLARSPAGAPIVLEPDWRGPPPPAADVSVVERRGVDLAPIDVTAPAARERLIAYVWPDQLERVRRLEAALSAAAADPPALDKGDAAGWTETHVTPREGTLTVLFHSIAYQYFPAATQARTAAHMTAIGAEASARAPLAWLRYEVDETGTDLRPTLRLRLWPGGDRLLAYAHPHGTSVRWLD